MTGMGVLGLKVEKYYDFYNERICECNYNCKLGNDSRVGKGNDSMVEKGNKSLITISASFCNVNYKVSTNSLKLLFIFEDYYSGSYDGEESNKACEYKDTHDTERANEEDILAKSFGRVIKLIVIKVFVCFIRISPFHFAIVFLHPPVLLATWAFRVRVRASLLFLLT